MGLNGPSGGRGEEAKGQPRAPLPKSELDKEGGDPLPFPLSLLPSPLLLQQGRGVLLPVGGGLLLARPSWPADPLLLAPL